MNQRDLAHAMSESGIRLSTVRMIIFGLDGATFDVINPNLTELPTLKGLMEKGASGNLESTIPMNTAVAWPALTTGKNPGKLGIFDFMVRDPKTGRLHIIDFSRLSYNFFWKYLKGKDIGLASIPAIPFQDVSSFFIQGSLVTMPPDGTFIARGERLGLPSYYDHYIKWYDGEDKILTDLHKRIDDRVETFKYVIRKCDPDLSFLVFNAIDHIQHHFWGYMDKKNQNYRDTIYKDSILEIYKQVDKGIKEILDVAGDERIYTMIVSDHGFGPRYRTFNINSWLNKNRYLYYEKQLIKKWSYKLLRIAYRVASRIPDLIKRIIVKRYLTGSRKHLIEERKKLIDWSRTKAYSEGYHGPVFINLKRREELVAVEKDEYERLRQEIVERLRRLRDPETGAQVLEKILEKERIYNGIYFDVAPDILLVPNKGYEITNNLHASPVFQKEKLFPGSGTHRPQGVFILKGPAVRRGLRIEKANICDIAPTILHMYSVPIPRGMDGRVLKEIFEENCELQRREIRHQKELEAERGPIPLRGREAEIVRKRLEGLGYF